VEESGRKGYFRGKPESGNSKAVIKKTRFWRGVAAKLTSDEFFSPISAALSVQT
jgi:hypothetical protein